MAMVTLRQNKIMMLQTWGFYFYLLILHMKEMENERCQMPAKVQIATGSKCKQKYRLRELQSAFSEGCCLWTVVVYCVCSNVGRLGCYRSRDCRILGQLQPLNSYSLPISLSELTSVTSRCKPLKSINLAIAPTNLTAETVITQHLGPIEKHPISCCSELSTVPSNEF